MALFFLVAGALLVMTAYQDTTDKFLALLKDDLIGDGGFLIWAGVLVVISIGGAVLGLGKPARILVVIMVAAFVLRNPDVLSKLQSAVQNAGAGPAPSTAAVGAATQVAGTTAQPTNGETSTASAAPASGAKQASGGLGGIIGSITGGLGSLFGGK